MAQTPPADPKGAAPLGEQRTRPPRIRAAAALTSLLVAAALLFVGWSYFWPRAASAETPTVAVLPFADLSQAGDKAYFAEGVAVGLVHARKAISLAPKSSHGYAALGLVLPDEQAIQPLKRAIELDPARSEVRVRLALAYEALGRNDESLRELEAAASIDPLWTVPINRLNNVLAASGRFGDARRVAQTYLERGGERAQAARFRSVIARYSADLSEAVRLATTARKLDPDVPYLKPALESDAAILNLPQLVSWEPGNRLFSWLNAKGYEDRLLAEARRAGTALWARPDRAIAIWALTENRDWQHLEVLFDAAASADVQVCTGRVEVILAGAQALHHQGRTEEAARLLRCAQQKIAAHTRGRTRSDALDRASLHFNRAQILALLGEREAAINALEEAVRYGWRGYPYSAKLASYPALDALRPTVKYSQIQRLLSQTVAAEQQQVLRDLKSRRRPDTL